MKNQIEIMGSEESENYPHDQVVYRELVIKLVDQLDEPEKSNCSSNCGGGDGMTEREKEEQIFKKSTLKIIKKLEVEPEPDVETIEWLYRLIENELPL